VASVAPRVKSTLGWLVSTARYGLGTPNQNSISLWANWAVEMFRRLFVVFVLLCALGGVFYYLTANPSYGRYYARYREFLQKYVEMHKASLKSKYEVMNVNRSDQIGDPYVFASNGRMHFVIYRGVPVGKTEEIVYSAKNENVEDFVADYLHGKSVISSSSLEHHWIYIYYYDN
jgi:hypothetical protein